MALKKTYNGKTIYVRVDRCIVGKLAQVPDLLVGIYEQTASELKQQTKMHFFFTQGTDEWNLFTPEALSPAGMNPLKKAYEYLKTLPQFSEYEDA